jgi:hypothetical protein
MGAICDGSRFDPVRVILCGRLPNGLSRRRLYLIPYIWYWPLTGQWRTIVAHTEIQENNMEHRYTATGSAIAGAPIAMHRTERVVSIMDFDSTGMINCLVTKPLANGPASIRDSRSARSLTTDEWTEISGK